MSEMEDGRSGDVSSPRVLCTCTITWFAFLAINAIFIDNLNGIIDIDNLNGHGNAK